MHLIRLKESGATRLLYVTDDSQEKNDANC